MKIVLAGSYQEFKDYCKVNNLKERKDAVYVTNDTDMYQYSYTMQDIVTTGTFWDSYQGKMFRNVERYARDYRQRVP